MAIVAVPEFLFPDVGTYDHDALATLAITASGNKVTFVFRAPKSGQITRVGFLLGTVTTPGTLRVSLQNTDIDGFPDGTPDQFYTLINPTAGWQSGTLSIPRSVQISEIFAVVIELTTVGSMLIGCVGTIGAANRYVFQGSNYVILNATKQPTLAPSIDFEWADGVRAVIPGNYPFASIATFGPNTSVFGIRYKPPNVIRVRGIWARLLPSNLSLDVVSLQLWDALDNIVRTTYINMRSSVLVAAQPAIMCAYFDTPYSVPANTIIHVVFSNDFGTTQLYYSGVYTSAGVIREGLPGGKEFWMATRTGGNWDDFLVGDLKPGRWPHMGLIIDGLEEGVGSASTTNLISSSDIFALKVRSKV